MNIKIADNIRGEKVFFDEKQHIYRTEQGKVLTSGTTFLKGFAEEFDAKTISEKYAKKHGLNAAEVRKGWKEKGEKSTKFGTKIHLYCENFIKNEWLPEPLDQKETKYMEVCKKELPKLLKNYDIIETEKIIFSSKLGVAGTIDLLCKNKKNGKIALLDYKTNEKIRMENSWQSMLPPLIHLDDTEMSKYSLQLNLYKNILMSEGYFDKNTKYEMKLIHITSDGFKYINVKDMQFEIENMFKYVNEE